MAKGTGAYDLSLFERGNPSFQTVHSSEKAARRKAKKERYDKRRAMVRNVVVAVVFVVVAALVINNRIQLTEINDRIADSREELAILQSETSRLTNELSAKTSAQSVDAYAEENGMVKVESYQIEYITVDGGDKTEVYDPAPEGVFETIGAAIAGWFGA